MFESINDVTQFFIERQKFGIKPGLDRVEFLLEQVDHPEQKINGIHVAGTNGKGSTIQIVDEVLQAHQYRVGVFTSPSFTGITGHFFINGETISENDFLQLLNELLPHIQLLDGRDNHPTEFEILTVIGLMYFSEQTDIVLVETGMGGRYDTTNCFTPLISVITSIDYDHMGFLGDRLEEIAFHKAGIMKKERPLVIGKVTEAVRKVIDKEANKLAVPVYAYGVDFQLDGENVTIKNEAISYDTIHLGLLGVHQKENASVALMVFTLLQKLGWELETNYIKKALQQTTLPGRLEVIHEHPTIILDSAHNVAGVRALAKTIENLYSQDEKILLFAGFSDKQLPEMMTILRPLFEQVYVTTFDHERAATEKQLKETLDYDLFIEQWEQKVLDMFNGPKEKTYVISGSLHFITLVRQFILMRKNRHYS